jgi:phospholipid/cholesterol/gamma-HCH transport system substrate-binding protein
MATLRTKFSVGLFLIIGMAAAIVGIIWLGMSNYFEKGRYFVSYFDESVQGLDKDSPVKYRGVHIGRVSHIGVAPDERLIEVILKIESDIKPQKGTEDIVARLKSVGITGLMFIELERKGPGEPDVSPPIDFEPPYPVIPTRPSDISKIFKGIEDIFDMFRAVDTQAISQQLVAVLAKLNTSIDALQVESLSTELRTALKNFQTMLQPERINRLMGALQTTSNRFSRLAANADDGVTDIRRTLKVVDRVVSDSGGDVTRMTEDLKQVADQLRTAAASASALIENTDRQVNHLNRQMLSTLQRIDQAADALVRFLDQLNHQPSRLIFSAPAPDKPPAP